MKLQRNERVAALTKILSDRPNHIFTFNEFTEMFACSKSTLSEDVDILKGTMHKLRLGSIQTISGAAGGVKYVPLLDEEQTQLVLKDLCRALSDSERILPGGYIYMTDIIYSSYIAHQVGKIFSAAFIHKPIDYVVTVETKGIPLAMMTARCLDVPLVIVRRNSKVTEGSTVNINYVSASNRTIQTMSLSRRAIKKNTNVLFVDDFMKGGGTATGIIDLMKEFESNVAGIAVLMSTKKTKEYFTNHYISLIVLNNVNASNRIIDLEAGIK